MCLLAICVPSVECLLIVFAYVSFGVSVFSILSNTLVTDHLVEPDAGWETELLGSVISLSIR